MMDCIKSRFSKNIIFWGCFMLLMIFLNLSILYKTIVNFKIEYIFFLILFVALFIYSLKFIAKFKFIKIKNGLIYSISLILPFRKEIPIDSFKCKFFVNEYGSIGVYRVLYLVDKRGVVFFRIYELFYDNFDLLESSIDLPILKYKLTKKEYFKLLFMGKIVIEI